MSSEVRWVSAWPGASSLQATTVQARVSLLSPPLWWNYFISLSLPEYEDAGFSFLSNFFLPGCSPSWPGCRDSGTTWTELRLHRRPSRGSTQTTQPRPPTGRRCRTPPAPPPPPSRRPPVPAPPLRFHQHFLRREMFSSAVWQIKVISVSENLQHIFILKLWQVQKVVKQNYNFKNSKLHRRQTAPGWIFSLSLTSLLLWLEVWVDVGIRALLTHVCGVVGDGELVNLHLPIST